MVAFRNFEEEMKRPDVWESEQGGPSTTQSSRDNLAALYRPPFALMHQGSFEKVCGSISLKIICFSLLTCFLDGFFNHELFSTSDYASFGSGSNIA